MKGYVIGPREKLNTVVMRHGYVVKLPFQQLRLYTQISATLNLGQEGFSLQWSAVNAKTHNWSK